MGYSHYLNEGETDGGNLRTEINEHGFRKLHFCPVAFQPD
jgi:hypothetical protein